MICNSKYFVSKYLAECKSNIGVAKLGDFHVWNMNCVL
jgi:hypothetical protein